MEHSFAFNLTVQLSALSSLEEILDTGGIAHWVAFEIDGLFTILN